MAFLQEKLCDPAELQTKPLNRQAGFLTVGLFCFLSLMFITLAGFSLLSLGIKNSTQAQSYCLKSLSQTQKQLGRKLRQLLKLNQKVRLLDRSRKSLDASIAVAAASVVLIPKIPALKKSKEIVELGQKSLTATQKGILIQSHLIKRQNLRELKSKLKTLNARGVAEEGFYRKALAVQKEEIGAEAYIYKPMKEFETNQKIKMSWRLPAFSALEKDLSWIFSVSKLGNRSHAGDFLNFSGSGLKPFHFFGLKRSRSSPLFIKQSCATSLEQKGEQWVYRLSY